AIRIQSPEGVQRNVALRPLRFNLVLLNRRRNVNLRIILEFYGDFCRPRPGERPGQALGAGTNHMDSGDAFWSFDVEIDVLILDGQSARALAAKEPIVFANDRLHRLAEAGNDLLVSSDRVQ